MSAQKEMTAAEWREKFGLSPVKPGAAAAVKPSKYKNVIRVYQGVRYHSKAELAFELHLRMLQKLGKVLYWLRQVPFAMPADDNTERVERYLLDFLVIQPCTLPLINFQGQPLPQRVRLVDVKGYMTGRSKTKIAAIQATYHVKIETPRREDIETWL